MPFPPDPQPSAHPASLCTHLMILHVIVQPTKRPFSPSISLHAQLPLPPLYHLFAGFLRHDMMTSNPFVHLWVLLFFTPQVPSHCVYAVKPPHHFVQYCANIADEVVVKRCTITCSHFLSFPSDSRSLPNIQILVLLYLTFFQLFYPHWRVFTFSLHYHSFFFLLHLRCKR
jgi:hypothetical protein